jgi:hypothetical protein
MIFPNVVLDHSNVNRGFLERNLDTTALDETEYHRLKDLAAQFDAECKPYMWTSHGDGRFVLNNQNKICEMHFSQHITSLKAAETEL